MYGHSHILFVLEDKCMIKIKNRLVAMATAALLVANTTVVNVYATEIATPTDAGYATVAIDNYCYGGILPIPQLESDDYDVTQAKIEYKEKTAPEDAYSEEQPTAVGEYSIRATFPANEMYGEFVAESEFEITYLDAPEDAYNIEADYVAEDKKHKTVWIKEGNEATIIPEAGFAVAEELDGYYEDNISITEKKATGEVNIFLQNIGTGEKTDAIAIEEAFDVDGVAPTGSITINDKNDTTFTKFLHFISFGLFFKERKVATIDAVDEESGLQSVSYCLTTELLFDEGASYTTDEMEQKLKDKGIDWYVYENEISLEKDNIYIVYAKLIDNVGNVTYLNTSGIVVFSDVSGITDEVTYAKGMAEDTTVIGQLNGNSVKVISDGVTELIEESAYVIVDDKLIIKGDYLNSLAVGEYNLLIDFNPYGVHADEINGDEPTKANIKIKCTKNTHGDASLVVGDIYYGGAAPSVELRSTTHSTATAKIEYKELTADDNMYTSTVPTKVGEYTARATFVENDAFDQTSVTDDFQIAYLPAPKKPYTIEGEAGENGYYTSDVIIKPATGYLIANQLDGDYKEYLTVGESNADKVIYLEKQDTKEKTAGIPVDEILIDKDAATVNGLIDGETYYGEYVEFTVDTEDITDVYVNGTQTALNGNILQLESRYGVEKYELKFVDKAGHNIIYNIKVAAEWTRTNHIPAEQTVRLQPGYVYHLDAGIWWIDGDTTEYKGYYKLHVDTEGTYVFHNRK